MHKYKSLLLVDLRGVPSILSCKLAIWFIVNVLLSMRCVGLLPSEYLQRITAFDVYL